MAKTFHAPHRGGHQATGIPKIVAVLGVVVASVVIGGIAYAIMAVAGSYNEDKTQDCTITSKDTITKVENGNSTTEKRVGTEECGVFTVNDSFVKGNLRSADLYYSLKEGHKYTLTYNGWRNGFTSSFPNITKAVEVK